MTAKEIAGVTGKDIRTVQRWARDLGDKMSSVNDKMSLSSPAHPADFDLDETCAIIEAGMGAAAAGVYRASAKPDKSVRIISNLKTIFNGSALDKFIHMYGEKEAGRRIDYLIGYPQTLPMVQSLPDKKADAFPPELAAYKNKAITAASAMKARDEVKKSADRKQLKLEVSR